MKKLLLSFVCALFWGIALAQVGINTDSPQTELDVNGSIQLRNELQVDGNPGTPGQIYFSQGDSPADLNDWKNVNVPFLEEGQYQLVNTYAVKDEVGIDWVGNALSAIKSFPYTESFNNSSIPNLWSNEYVSVTHQDWVYATDGTGYSGVGPNSPKSGSRNARFADTNPPGQITKLVTPKLDLSELINPKVRFYYAQPNWVDGGTTYQNVLKIYYKTSSSSSWVLFNTYNDNITVWTERTLALPNPSSTYQIAFEATNNYGYPTILDDVTVFGDNTVSAPSEGYDNTLSTLGETITAKNWTKIPGLDLDIQIKDSNNKISMIFQTGVESRTNPGNNGSAQTEGNIRYMCGVFRKLKSAADNTAVLVAVRGDQINNAVGKPNQLKSQSIYTLTYTVQDVPAEEYTFSVACRRLSTTTSESQALLSIGNAVNGSGTGKTNDFMLNSILKVDVIELVTVTGL